MMWLWHWQFGSECTLYFLAKNFRVVFFFCTLRSTFLLWWSILSLECSLCHGELLNVYALSLTFAGSEFAYFFLANLCLGFDDYKRNKVDRFFFLDYTVQFGHSQHTYNHPYEHTYANLTSMSIFEIWAPSDWRSHYICLTVDGSSTTESTTPLNPRIFAPIESRI